MKHRNAFWQNFLKKYFIDFIRFYSHLRFSINVPGLICPDNIQFNIVYAQKWFYYYKNKYPLICKQIDRLLNNHYKKKQRIIKRLKHFVNCSDLIYFGTLTFEDSVLSSVSKDTRRTYVRRFLKKNCLDYVANIDYGSLNNREHYHCCFTAIDDQFFDNWQYGFVNVKQVWSDNDFRALSEYIVKLANHSIKDGTDGVIYSRS